MLQRTAGGPVHGRLVYRRGDRGLDVEPHPDSGGTSLLVNDTQIELDEDARLVYVWGYCPHESWQPARLEPPRSSLGRLSYSGQAIIPGVSIRLNEQRWPVLFDDSTGWICLGDPAARGDAVEFSPGATAVLNDGSLQALWLHPEFEA
jgi:hypothetical protein